MTKTALPEAGILRSRLALGRAACRLVGIDPARMQETPLRTIGYRFEKALLSATRALTPGRQSAKQLDASLDAARKAVLRYLR